MVPRYTVLKISNFNMEKKIDVFDMLFYFVDRVNPVGLPRVLSAEAAARLARYERERNFVEIAMLIGDQGNYVFSPEVRQLGEHIEVRYILGSTIYIICSLMMYEGRGYFTVDRFSVF